MFTLSDSRTKNNNNEVSSNHDSITDISSVTSIQNINNNYINYVKKDMSGDVQLFTTMGSIIIELYWKHAPKTCYNFYELSKNGYYDNCIFHRIIENFCIQGGDPTGTGKGGKSIYGDMFDDEIHPGLRHTGAGVVSMANCGRNTNSSQFFITLAPCPYLDNKHSIFGRIKKGMEVVKKMASVQTTATDKPIFDVKIIRASTAI